MKVNYRKGNYRKSAKGRACVPYELDVLGVLDKMVHLKLMKYFLKVFDHSSDNMSVLGHLTSGPNLKKLY